jgi:Protein of unknown function (DUF2877)
VTSQNIINPAGLQKIPGFETTDYAYLNGHIVWAGQHASTQHARNIFSSWEPVTIAFDSEKLLAGALICKRLFESELGDAIHAKGLLLWLTSKPMPFPLNLSTNRFDAIRQALTSQNLNDLTAASLRVLGLGNGLTPSGDDFVGGMMFALVHAPCSFWQSDLPKAIASIHETAKVSTNVISAALLDDLMAGKSYSALHDVLIALQSNDAAHIEYACENILNVGASSGADMLAGLLLALTTQATKIIH